MDINNNKIIELIGRVIQEQDIEKTRAKRTKEINENAFFSKFTNKIVLVVLSIMVGAFFYLLKEDYNLNEKIENVKTQLVEKVNQKCESIYERMHILELNVVKLQREK
jgi:hypothetical protein